MAPLGTILLSSVLALAGLSNAECTRESLTTATDNFFKAASGTHTFALDPAVKVSENGVLKTSIADTAAANITDITNPFRIQSVDTDACQVVTFVVATEKSSSTPALFSVRLRLPSSTSAPTEVEIINATKQNVAFGFYPGNLKPESFWATPQTTTPSIKPLTHAELINVTNTYANGVQNGDGASIPAAKSCVRYEDGFKIPVSCTTGFAALKYPVYSRRWVADTQTGVVVGSYGFALKPQGPYMMEFFKVEDGKIREVQANWISMKYGVQDVWPGGTDQAF